MKKVVKLIYRCLFILLSCSLLPACDTTKSYQVMHQSSEVILTTPEIKLLQHRHFERNPIIVIHGLLGGKLKGLESHKSIWGDFSIKNMRESSYINELAMPMSRGVPISQIPSNAVTNGILDITTIALRDNPWIYLESYEVLIKNLEKFGYYRVQNNAEIQDVGLLPPVYAFSYDWRKDISLNVVELHKFILEKEAQIQKLYEQEFGIKDYKVKFDIIAHSMGGLLTRYYLQYGPQVLPDDGQLPQASSVGAEKIEKAIIVGTPNMGYVDTLIELHQGLVLYPGMRAIPEEILGTFSSYYFMLPNYGTKSVIYSDNHEEVDIFDIEVWKKYKWGLASDSKKTELLLMKMLPSVEDREERKAIALDHLEKNLKRASQFHKAMGKNLPADKNTILYLLAGNAFKSNRRVVIDRQTGEIVDKISDSGDGKVTLSSALYDRRSFSENQQIFMSSPIPWKTVYTCGASHMGIFASPEFWANLSLILLTEGTERQQEMKYQD